MRVLLSPLRGLGFMNRTANPRLASGATLSRPLCGLGQVSDRSMILFRLRFVASQVRRKNKDARNACFFRPLWGLGFMDRTANPDLRLGLPSPARFAG